jgi:hypothetical protein
MPLTTKNIGAALIEGRAIPREITMATRKVQVLRSFYYERTAMKVGDTVELPALFANELIANNKAQAVIEPEKAAEPAAPASPDRGKKQSEK